MLRRNAFLLVVMLLVNLFVPLNVYAESTPVEELIFDNGNIGGVLSNPTNPTTFTVSKTYVITNISNYHYFNNGVLPGLISLKHSDGTVYGPWQTSGLLGQAGVQNASWNVSLEVTIKPGTYTVIDSDVKTWSHNAESGFKGFSIIKGYPKPEVTQVPEIVTPAVVDDSAIVFLKIGNPTMYINGDSFAIDPGRNTAPIVKDGRTLLPIKAIIEGLGGSVSWNGTEKKVSIKLNNNLIETWIGRKSYTINGVSKTMDVAPGIINSRTMVPLRFIAENFNATVHWEGTQKLIMVTYYGSVATVHTINANSNSYYIADTTKAYLINYEDKVTVYIPENSLSQPDAITITPATLNGVDTTIASPLYSYDISIGNQHEFKNELTIRFSYDKSKMDANYSDELQLFATSCNATTGALETVPFTVVPSTGLFYMNTNHLSFKTVFKMNTKGQYFADVIKSKGFKSTETPVSGSSYFDTFVTALNQKVITPVKGWVATAGKTIDDVGDWATDIVTTLKHGWGTAISLGLNPQKYVLITAGDFVFIYDDDSNFTDVKDAFGYIDKNLGNYRSDYKAAPDKYPDYAKPTYDIKLEYKNNGKTGNLYDLDALNILPDPLKDLMYAANAYSTKLKALGIVLNKDPDLYLPIYVLPIGTQAYDDVTNSVFAGMADSGFSTTETIVQNACHEIFHYVQYNGYYSRNGLASATLSMTANDWINDATAEYASVALGLEKSLMKNPKERPMSDAFFSEHLSKSSDPHLYQSAYFIEYLINQKGMKFNDFMIFYAKQTNASQSLYPEEIIEDYFAQELREDTTAADLYAEFVAYMLLKNEGPYASINVNKSVINKATASLFDLKTNKWEQTLAAAAFTPRILSVELPSTTTAKSYNLSVPCYENQVIYVYALEGNKKIANPVPIQIIRGEGDVSISISTTPGVAKALYFISISSKEISAYHSDKIMLQGVQNITTVKQTLRVERGLITDAVTNTVSEGVIYCEGNVELLLPGYETVANLVYVWDMGDGNKVTTNTNKLVYVYKNLTEAYKKSVNNPFLQVGEYKVSVAVYKNVEGEQKYWFTSPGYVSLSGFSIK